MYVCKQFVSVRSRYSREQPNSTTNQIFRPLPFKGRDRVGTGLLPSLQAPIPSPTLPFEGEGEDLNYLQRKLDLTTLFHRLLYRPRNRLIVLIEHFYTHTITELQKRRDGFSLFY